MSLHPGFRPWAPGVEIPPAYNEAILGQRVRLPRLTRLQMPLSESTHQALRADARPYR